MKNKLFYFIVIAFLLNFEPVLSQIWVKNEFVDYFANKIVFDIAKDANTYWVLCKDGLYNYNNTKIVKYQLDGNSKGSINNYCTDKKDFTAKFSQCLLINNVLWLFSNGSEKMLCIQKDSVVVFEIPRMLDEHYGYTWFAFDSRDNFWILCTASVNLNIPINYSFYKFNGTFKKVNLPVEIHGKYIRDFFVKDDDMYFINTVYDTLNILKVESSGTTKNIILDTNNNTLAYSHYFYKENLFVLGANHLLYVISGDKLINTQINGNYNYSFNFVVKEDIFYLPSVDGLVSYHLTYKRDNFLKDFKMYKPVDFDENCYKGFDKIINDNNEFIILYGGSYVVPCNSQKAGFALFNLE
jgi:hypothetical protein